MSRPTADITLHFGARFKAKRKAMFLSQADVADRIGVSRRTVQAWEAGKSYPSPRHGSQVIAFFEEAA